jgi:LL-diaminopimelate aminotransferase
MEASRRLECVPSYPFVGWNELCRIVEARGVDVIRLDIGNPDLPPPEPVIDALCTAARANHAHGYPGIRTRAPLREAIAAYYERRFGVHLDPQKNIVPLLGSKEGIIHLSLTCLNPGDIALVPNPGYAPYARATYLAGATPVFFPLREESGYLPDLDAIPVEIAQKATLLWLNYPNNPTGACADLDFLSKAVAFARRYDIVLCHDAPYTDVAFGGVNPPSILEVPGGAEVAVELNSLSKTFNMAGWRVGMALGRPDILSLLAQLKTNIDSGQFLPIQTAAIEALNTSATWIDNRNAIYKTRLDLLAEGLRCAGFQVQDPQATLYLWATLPAGALSEDAAQVLLETAGISAAPGTFFGAGGEGHFRFSASTSTARIALATERLKNLPTDWIQSDQTGIEI